MTLRDGGKPAFRVGPLAIWTGFGALDGALEISILVHDSAIAVLEPDTAIAHVHVVEANRERLLRIADRKYQEVKGDPVRVTASDL